MTAMGTLSTSQDLSSQASTLTLEMLLHDLTAPVRHIEFFVDQLRASLVAPTVEQAAWIHRIVANLATERTLLQDSRLLLSFERHPVVAWDQPVRVNVLLADLASSFRSDVEKRGLILNLDLCDDVEVVVDPKAVARVIANLVGNALKATAPGGTITIRSRIEGNQVVFDVADTGAGFTMEEATKLSGGWDDFDRGVNPPGMWGGLGLLICHSIVRKYGGRLGLASDGPGKGSTFSFGVRLAESSPNVPGALGAQPLRLVLS